MEFELSERTCERQGGGLKYKQNVHNVKMQVLQKHQLMVIKSMSKMKRE